MRRPRQPLAYALWGQKPLAWRAPIRRRGHWPFASSRQRFAHSSACWGAWRLSAAPTSGLSDQGGDAPPTACLPAQTAADGSGASHRLGEPLDACKTEQPAPAGGRIRPNCGCVRPQVRLQAGHAEPGMLQPCCRSTSTAPSPMLVSRKGCQPRSCAAVRTSAACGRSSDASWGSFGLNLIVPPPSSEPAQTLLSIWQVPSRYTIRYMWAILGTA